MKTLAITAGVAIALVTVSIANKDSIIKESKRLFNEAVYGEVAPMPSYAAAIKAAKYNPNEVVTASNTDLYKTSSLGLYDSEAAKKLNRFIAHRYPNKMGVKDNDTKEGIVLQGPPTFEDMKEALGADDRPYYGESSIDYGAFIDRGSQSFLGGYSSIVEGCCDVCDVSYGNIDNPNIPPPVVTSVPEPSTLSLLSIGAIFLMFMRRNKYEKN